MIGFERESKNCYDIENVVRVWNMKYFIDRGKEFGFYLICNRNILGILSRRVRWCGFNFGCCVKNEF